MNTTNEERAHVLVRWLPLVMGLLYTAGAALFMVFGLHAQGTGEDALAGTLLLAAACLPLGAVLGYGGRRLLEKNGALGGAAFAAMILGGVLAWIAAASLLGSQPGDPEDIGWVTTSWVWENLEWGGFLLYFLSVPFDVILIVFYLLFSVIAVVVVPPASFLCAAFAIFLFLAPLLFLLRRRRERAATAGPRP